MSVQSDYKAIKDFSGDWSKSLREKYNMTEEEVLNNIEL
ncbi:hypothetical protein Phi4:1_gp166 [Cellulophaga phage phi4:1]|uniref:Uncharacterized protein n=5 Tax=Lightbulbvirus TaxID=1918522 RepID=A0A0S2MWR3_9CAUD|nr:hypothetical protein Phi4:1_gp166 [Cellulophaga phage phi4:1]YP_008241665.1 hypothetical protein Phi17:2_gp170 [Cellulophaga phage phi17:2]ALO80175.1 hypothetical protein Phi4113_166 [Cellulophaga phage phi4:1_13]ALO80372.1 hypothetical protein Phi4118_166 [Cellulophaga phage phi4:1_18]ALO80573.1 hypothetical protein Phi17218_170 [Cellulophaga phage phi17:2_18]AGO47703.1 hypothetical protein Phi17:2_gp170 [Cellulophaga phage phi17:2]AGO49579.1 hypothetical protein Phi4:1_gp166 [Cellulophag